MKRVTPHASGVLISVWVSPQKKIEFEALARRRGMTQSKLLRDLIIMELEQDSALQGALVPNEHHGGMPIVIELPKLERFAIRERAALQNLSAPSYIRVLVRAHLKSQPALFKQEFVTLEAALSELNSVAKNLNHLVKAADAGVCWTGGIRKELAILLKIFGAIASAISQLKRLDRNTP